VDGELFLTFLVLGVTASAVYAISATGLVVTYVTSGVFNFAHGAIGMFLAFVYWELHVNRGWPTVLALLVTLGVAAPLIGLLLDVIVMRRLLRGASVTTKLVVTLALLLAFQGLTQSLWGTELRVLPNLWGDRTFKLFDVVVLWDQATSVLLAIAIAFGLRMLFRHTRLGVAMRAVVDSPELCATKGLSPNRVTATSWAIGSALAGLAAILLAPGLNLEINTLIQLVVAAYAAAIVGRLQSLPLTFVGALLIGFSQTYVTLYLPQDNELVRNLKPAIPFLILFAALLIRPERRLPERLRTHAEPAPPSLRVTAAIGAAAVAAVWAVSSSLSVFQLGVGSKALLFSCITLSLVLLTGLSGQVSLMQMSFVGIGAVVIGKLSVDIPWLVALAIAALAAGAVGGLIALPVLRLRGIYLALCTLAFAILMDSLFFGNSHIFGGGESVAVRRPWLPFVGEASDTTMLVLTAVACAIYANIFLAVRRSAFGRMLSAMRDSPTASQMMGMNIVALKLRVFALSALLAGSAGALLGGLQARVGQLDFLYFRSYTVLLVATIFGITSVSGALLGAGFFVVLPEILHEAFASDDTTTASGLRLADALPYLIIGLLAIIVARRPEGIAGMLRGWLQRVRRWRPMLTLPQPSERQTPPVVADV
jgi:branched-chain amino acid transport system permease protein